ncbi:hypothetical protein Syun_026031 [Stephania yunnanensis]|uniref:Uncharacterized protein n=1 Tax=Stephania yunnanensis TaxID=152371 RepID=A0AAP0HWB4_9MAGN
MVESIVDVPQLARLCDAPNLYLKCMNLTLREEKAQLKELLEGVQAMEQVMFVEQQHTREGEDQRLPLSGSATLLTHFYCHLYTEYFLRTSTARNQVKEVGAPAKTILGSEVQFSLTGTSTYFVSLVLSIHVMIVA